MQTTKAYLVAVSLLAACPAYAGALVTDLDLAPVDVTQPGFYAESVIPRFDPTLGTLTNVTLTVTGVVMGTQTGTPLLNVVFSDEADHMFGLDGAVFSTGGPITPQGVAFSITTQSGYAAQNVSLFEHLFPGTTLGTSVFANGFDGEVTFATDTLTYTYTAIPEPLTLALLLAPALAFCTWRTVPRRPSAGQPG